MKKMTLFKPSVHGWPFTNTNPPGDAAGMCYGMCCLALDYFFTGRMIQKDSAPDEGTALLDGILEYQNNQSNNYEMGRMQMADASEARQYSINTEWPEIRNSINQGNPALVYLNKLTGLCNCDDEDANHAAVAYGYEESSPIVSIYLYDPNHSKTDDILISFNQEDYSITWYDTIEYRGFLYGDDYTKPDDSIVPSLSSCYISNVELNRIIWDVNIKYYEFKVTVSWQSTIPTDVNYKTYYPTPQGLSVSSIEPWPPEGPYNEYENLVFPSTGGSMTSYTTFIPFKHSNPIKRLQVQMLNTVIEKAVQVPQSVFTGRLFAREDTDIFPLSEDDLLSSVLASIDDVEIVQSITDQDLIDNRTRIYIEGDPIKPQHATGPLYPVKLSWEYALGYLKNPLFIDIDDLYIAEPYFIQGSITEITGNNRSPIFSGEIPYEQKDSFELHDGDSRPDYDSDIRKEIIIKPIKGTPESNNGNQPPDENTDLRISFAVYSKAYILTYHMVFAEMIFNQHEIEGIRRTIHEYLDRSIITRQGRVSAHPFDTNLTRRSLTQRRKAIDKYFGPVFADVSSKKDFSKAATLFMIDNMKLHCSRHGTRFENEDYTKFGKIIRKGVLNFSATFLSTKIIKKIRSNKEDLLLFSAK